MKFKGKTIKVVLSEDAAEEYNELNRIVGEELQRGITSSANQSIFRFIERVKGWLKDNPFAGEQVQKSKIPNFTSISMMLLISGELISPIIGV